MGRFCTILLDHDYRDLASIQSEKDKQKIISLFEKPGHRLKIRLLLEELNKLPAIAPSAPAPAPEVAAPSIAAPSPEAPVEAAQAEAPAATTTVRIAPSEPSSSPTSWDDVSRERTKSKYDSEPDSDRSSSTGSLEEDVDMNELPPALGDVASVEIPPFPESDIDSESDDQQEPAPSAADVTASPESKPEDGRPRQSSTIRKRQEAFLKQAQAESSAPKPKPAGAVPMFGGGSDAFKSKAAMMGMALQASLAKGPPVFKKRDDTPDAVEEKPPEPIIRFAPTNTERKHPPPPPPPNRPLQAQPQSASSSETLNTLQAASSTGSLLFDDEDDAVSGLPAVSSLVNPEKAGVLDKRGVDFLNQSWKSRFFILKGPVLYWVKKRDDKFPAGMIQISQRGLTFRDTDERTIEIVTPKKVYVLRAENSQSMDEWSQALKGAQMKFKEEPAVQLPASSSSSFIVAQASLPQEETARLLEIIRTGSMFIKYKHKKGQDRMIWATNSLDRVVWGDGSDKKKIKGFILVADMLRITDGCFGSNRNENAFTVVGKDRTLELEAPSLTEKNDWVKVLNYLIACTRRK